MTPAQWQRVRELFEAALDASPENLREWLDAQSPDSVVRGEVESLLNYHSRAGSFLNELGAGIVRSSTKGGCNLWTAIGHYTVVRSWAAAPWGASTWRGTPSGRQVALKALAPHLTGDPSHRERLKREARAAAGLTHSGICTVYALEEIDGYLFIASELLEGQTIREEIVRDRQPRTEDILATDARVVRRWRAPWKGHCVGTSPENVMRDRTGRLRC
jgi:serine/threonine protein kinase